MTETSDSRYQGYVRDLGFLLREKALEVKAKYSKGLMEEGSDYRAGQLQAYNFVIALLQQQADAFEISREEMGLSDIDPDRDLT